MNNKFRGIIIRDYLHSHDGTLRFLNSFYLKKWLEMENIQLCFRLIYLS